jgi:nuclear pore complex protein Nup188
MEFLSKALNSWAPILSTLRQDRALWAKLLILLAWSGIIVDTSDTPDQTLQKCWKLHTAAAAVDAIAVEIYHAGNASQAASLDVLRDHFVTKKDIKLQEIASEAFRIRGYRDSLFFHLRRNFQTKFPTADILRFQRSTAHERQFGESYFFDLDVGREVLGADLAWKGFEKEIRLANLNMSIVDAQLVRALDNGTNRKELFASWQRLALAWDENGQKALPLEGRTVILAKACLEANIAEAKLHMLLRGTICDRANLAFSLVGNPTVTMKPEEIKSILRLAFNALVAPELKFFDALTDGKFDIARPLIRTILTCLKRLDRKKDRPSGLLLDIFEAVVAKGATNLFNRARSVSDGEVADMLMLVTTIGQELVDLCNKDSVFSEFCNKLMDHNTIEAAVRLYGAGDQAILDEEPVFAELSLQFIVALSAAPRVPEQLAVAGILGYIMESPISNILQSTDIRAPQNLILHRVWTRGVLPIIFNLLQSLGIRLLRDAVAFLRLYEVQIQWAFTEWARPKLITTALVDETLLLLVLFEVVDSFLQTEQERFVFKGKEDLLENVNNLLAHPRFMARLVHPTSLEEVKLMEERREGEFKNGLVAKIATDLEEMRGLLGIVEQ